MADDNQSMVPVYLNWTHRVHVVDGDGKRPSEAVDHYGDAACPYCDFNICNERDTLRVGDKCRRCGATVVRLERNK